MNSTARNYYRDSRDPRRNYPTAAQEVHLRLLANLSNVIDPSVNKETSSIYGIRLIEKRKKLHRRI